MSDLFRRGGCGPGFVLAIACGLAGCSPSSATTDGVPSAGTPLPAAPKAAPLAEDPLKKVQQAKTLQAALLLTKPEMEDTINKTDHGSVLLWSWATKSMQWSDVSVAKDETTHALILKDPDEERGKRLCASGTIIEIESVKLAAGKGFEGLLANYATSLFRFMAVGSSGALVQHSAARFCGVVTG